VATQEVDSPALSERELQELVLLEQFRDLYLHVGQPQGRPRLENLLAELQIECRINQHNLRKIPRKGALVVVAGYYSGLVEGAILGTLIQAVRPDTRILASYLFAGLPDLDACCFFVDPAPGPGSVRVNCRAARRAVRWLNHGGALVAFPWHATTASARGDAGAAIERMIRITNATAVNVFLEPAAAERTFELRVGKPISFESAGEFGSNWHTHRMPPESAPFGFPVA
jgi:hypothetical protein